MVLSEAVKRHLGVVGARRDCGAAIARGGRARLAPTRPGQGGLFGVRGQGLAADSGLAPATPLPAIARHVDVVEVGPEVLIGAIAAGARARPAPARY